MTNQETAQLVADRTIELLDQGDLPPWEQPWKFSPLGDPRNAVSLKPYRGVNRWLTLIAQSLGGHEDTRWLTYKQAQDLWGHVRKGEKSTSIVFWKQVTKKNAGEETPGELMKRDTYWLAPLYRIFNVEQTEGCRLEPLPGPPDPSPDPIEEGGRGHHPEHAQPPGDEHLRPNEPGAPLRAPPGPGQSTHQGPVRGAGAVVQHGVPRADPRHRASEAAEPLQR